MRIIEVKGVQMHVSTHVDDGGRFYRPGGDAWLRVCGTFDEPLKGQGDVEISIHELDEEGPAHDRTTSIGALIQLKPQALVVIDMPHDLFDRTWAMAAGGKISFAWISMTKPKGRDALVLNLSFTNEPME